MSLRILALKIVFYVCALATVLSGCVLLGPDPGVIPSDYCHVRESTSRPIWFAGEAPTSEQMTWLPDNETIIIKNKAEKIFLVHLSESNGPILQNTDFQGWFSYSPATNAIAIVESSAHGTTVTRIYDLATGELLTSVHGFSGRAWSPDGTLLLGDNIPVEGKRWVSVFDFTESDAEPIVVLDDEKRSYYTESWSNGNDWFAIEKGTDSGIKFMVVDWPSRDVIELHEFQGCHKNSAWSPTSNEIAYQGNPSQDWDIFVETPGQTYRNLTESNDIHEEQPDWSPDGEHIAYIAVIPAGDQQRYQQELHVIEIETGNISELTNTVEDYEALPKWSPDGQKIAYLSAVGDQLYLYTIDPFGNNKSKIIVIPPN